MNDCCSDGFDKLRTDIQVLGWHMVLVPAEAEGPGFGYTIGLHERFQHPEIIIVGLGERSRPHVLGGVAERVKAGERFEPGPQYVDVIEKFPCVFRRVHARHYDEYVGQALRYYKTSESHRGAPSGRPDFPLLQCVYPDMEGRFPWDEGVNPKLAKWQPLLDAEWPFEDARNLAVFTTRQVLAEGAPVVFVTHDADGDWQFLCDTEDERRLDDARLVSLDSVFARDASLGALSDLPRGWHAWREEPGAPWQRAPQPAESSEDD